MRLFNKFLCSLIMNIIKKNGHCSLSDINKTILKQNNVLLVYLSKNTD